MYTHTFLFSPLVLEHLSLLINVEWKFSSVCNSFPSNYLPAELSSLPLPLLPFQPYKKTRVADSAHWRDHSTSLFQ